MTEKDLSWKTDSSKRLLHTPVFDVLGQHESALSGLEGDYIAIEAPDWVMVAPEYRGSLVLVRQWRHGEEAMSLELPGGIVDGGEEPEDAARRELLEETGFKAGRLTHLGTVNPNPALFKNKLHVYLAEEPEPTGEQSLDNDELLTYELMPVSEVIASYGSGEFKHALMGTALMMYLRHKSSV